MREFLASAYRRLTVGLLGTLLERCQRRRHDHQPVAGRLLYVPASSLPYHVSGYTTRTHEVIRALRDAGGDVRVLTRPGYPWDRGDRMQEASGTETLVDGIVYEHVRAPSKHRPILMYAMQAARAIEKVAARERVQVIQAASNHENALPALLAARRLGIRFQYEMRGLWELTRASRIAGYEKSAGFALGLELEGFVARNADCVFVISEQIGAFARKRWNIPSGRFELLPNCVNPERFLPPDPSVVEPNTIGYAGSLISYEGLDTLIDAIRILDKREVDVKVNIVGDGEARAELEQHVRSAGLSERIRILGRVAPEAAREILARCEIVCLPRKPFTVCEIVPPIKLVEALAMGKPAIVPDLPVFRDEMGESPAGWFFRSSDAADLADVIEAALRDKDTLEKKKMLAREHATARRCWGKFVPGVLRECAV